MDEVSDDLALAIHERSGGLPFAVEEMVRLALDSGVVLDTDVADPVSALDALGVPGAVRDSVLGRVDALGLDARAVVDAAAVVGVAASPSLLARVSALTTGRAAAAVCEALDAAVLVESETDLYGFRHLLAAQSVYQAIPTPPRTGAASTSGPLTSWKGSTRSPSLASPTTSGRRGAPGGGSKTLRSPPTWLVHATTSRRRRPPERRLAAPELTPPTRARLAAKLGRCAVYRRQWAERGAARAAGRSGRRGAAQRDPGDGSPPPGRAAGLGRSGRRQLRRAGALRAGDGPRSGVAVHLLTDLAAAPHLQIPVPSGWGGWSGPRR